MLFQFLALLFGILEYIFDQCFLFTLRIGWGQDLGPGSVGEGCLGHCEGARLGERGGAQEVAGAGSEEGVEGGR